MSSKTYIGTKAHALHGFLLDKPTVQKLAECTTLEELINRLRSTPYSDALASMAPPFVARRIELALRGRLAEVHHSLMSTAGKYKIFELYYLKYIAWDLKVALKSKALDRSYDETMEYLDMTAEELVGRRDLIVKVLTAKDVTEAVSLLSGTEFYEDAQKALALFAAKSEVRLFDVYIDHAVLAAIAKEYSTNFRTYASSRATDVAGVGDIVTNEIDSYNVLSVLRAKLWKLSEQEIQGLVVLPTYKVSATVLARMASSESVSEGQKLIDQIYPVPAQASQGDEQLIDEVEDEFGREMRNIVTKSFFWQGLGPGCALAVTKLLEFEVSNLAAIAIGIEAGMDPRKIASMLRL